jgi:hypothetical protein
LSILFFVVPRVALLGGTRFGEFALFTDPFLRRIEGGHALSFRCA